MNSFAMILTFVVALCSTVVGQGRIPRHLSNALGMPTYGGASISATPSGSVKLWVTGSQGTEQVSFATGISAVGAYEALGSTSLSGLLFVGQDSTGGRVEHWAPSGTPGTWSVQSTVSIPGLDLVGVAFDGTRLFVLDCVNKSVLQSSWNGTTSLAALSWTVYATQVEVPQLAAAEDQYLLAVGPSSVPGLTAAGIMLTDLFQTAEAKAGILVRDGSSGVLAEPCFVSRFGTPEGAVVDESTAFHGGTSVMVHASPGVVFEIVNGQSAVIGSGTGASDGSAVQVSLTEALVVGSTYQVKPVGSQAVAEFVCLQRYGFPENFSDGAQLTRIRLNPVEYRVGNLDFSMRTGIQRSFTAGPRVEYVGGCLLGLEGMPIVPIDNGSGLNQVLLTEFWIGALGWVAENAMTGQVSMLFPIANDPALEGLVLLGQFVVFDVTGFRLSEVVGFKIQAAN